MIDAMRKGYGLSYPLCVFLAFGGHFILGQKGELSLHDMARHNCLEHDASAGHADAEPGAEYAPVVPARESIDTIIAQASEDPEGAGLCVTPRGFAWVRVLKEEALTHPLKWIYKWMGHGEIAMVLCLFGLGRQAVSVNWIEEWWFHERIPEDWAPVREVGLLETRRASNEIKRIMQEFKSSRPPAKG